MYVRTKCLKDKKYKNLTEIYLVIFLWCIGGGRPLLSLNFYLTHVCGCPYGVEYSRCNGSGARSRWGGWQWCAGSPALSTARRYTRARSGPPPAGAPPGIQRPAAEPCRATATLTLLSKHLLKTQVGYSRKYPSQNPEQPNRESTPTLEKIKPN